MIRMSEHLLRGKMIVLKEKIPLSSDNILSSVRMLNIAKCERINF